MHTLLLTLSWLDCMYDHHAAAAAAAALTETGVTCRKACGCFQWWVLGQHAGIWRRTCGLAGASCLCRKECCCGFLCMLCRMCLPTGMNLTSFSQRDGAWSVPLIPPPQMSCLLYPLMLSQSTLCDVCFFPCLPIHALRSSAYKILPSLALCLLASC